jgi:phosphoadenosine phosphosulfate reductase
MHQRNCGGLCSSSLGWEEVRFWKTVDTHRFLGAQRILFFLLAFLLHLCLLGPLLVIMAKSTHSPSLPLPTSSHSPSTFQKKLSHAKSLILSALDLYGDEVTMSTSFGIQSAVLLHIVTSLKSSLPIVWIDTGYLPAETYRYALQLQSLLSLNLKIYQSTLSPAHMEAIHGKLWESSDPEKRRLYGLIRKVLPMKTAQKELNTKCLLIGLRKQQTSFRQQLQEIEEDKQDGCWKFYPLLHWTDEDIQQYFDLYQLPLHPLSSQGYTTVGDAHSSRPKTVNDLNDRMTRFGGTDQQECGLHTESGSFEFLQSLSTASPPLSLPPMVLATSPTSVGNIYFPSELSASSGVGSVVVPNPTNSDYVIYSRPSCKYCRAAKALTREKGYSYHEILVLTGGSMELMKERKQEVSIEELTLLIQRTRNDFGYSVTTVPQIFSFSQEQKQSQHLGGYTDLCSFLSLSEDERDEYLKLQPQEAAEEVDDF